MAVMAENDVDFFAELGAGRVLTGLVKRNPPGAAGMAVHTPADIEALAEKLKG